MNGQIVIFKNLVFLVRNNNPFNSVIPDDSYK